MQKITPCLWIDDRIEEAVNFYAKVFKGKVTRTPAAIPTAAPSPSSSSSSARISRC